MILSSSPYRKTHGKRRSVSAERRGARRRSMIAMPRPGRREPAARRSVRAPAHRVRGAPRRRPAAASRRSPLEREHARRRIARERAAQNASTPARARSRERHVRRIDDPQRRVRRVVLRQPARARSGGRRGCRASGPIAASIASTGMAPGRSSAGRGSSATIVDSMPCSRRAAVEDQRRPDRRAAGDVLGSGRAEAPEGIGAGSGQRARPPPRAAPARPDAPASEPRRWQVRR